MPAVRRYPDERKMLHRSLSHHAVVLYCLFLDLFLIHIVFLYLGVFLSLLFGTDTVLHIL